MKILIACEESQAVTLEFRKLGFEAYSADIQECSGGRPEWHYKGDVLEILQGMYKCKCGFLHSYGSGKYGCCGTSKLIEWDALIAFPPCTHLTWAGGKYWNLETKPKQRIEALNFVWALMNADIKYICIENPLGLISKAIRQHDQIIEPYYFGDAQKKRTCLWLKNLPPLYYCLENNLFEEKTAVEKPEPIYIDRSGKRRYFTEAITGGKNGGFNRSKTFPGIAKAMAEQWSKIIKP